MKVTLRVMNDAGEMVPETRHLDIPVGSFFAHTKLGNLVIMRPNGPLTILRHEGAFYLFQCLVMNGTMVDPEVINGEKLTIYRLDTLPVVDQSSFQ